MFRSIYSSHVLDLCITDNNNSFELFFHDIRAVSSVLSSSLILDFFASSLLPAMANFPASQIMDHQDIDFDDQYNIPTALKFVISNIKIIVHAQLSPDNYKQTKILIQNMKLVVPLLAWKQRTINIKIIIKKR
ncbi:hypothetical protein KFK09_004596 [Dendrobium nobile]|uniref:Uncharacterized protein n=1 Tax=Dendrobium nobile TaxID=94219 RepID=A0A8T3C3A7_DENNO|nr:hypothetical protein KFK09_004596 [Dendrobium nobile]